MTTKQGPFTPVSEFQARLDKLSNTAQGVRALESDAHNAIKALRHMQHDMIAMNSKDTNTLEWLGQSISYLEEKKSVYTKWLIGKQPEIDFLIHKVMED